MARWQLSASTVTMVPFSDSIASNFGTAVISFDFASVAIWPSTMRCSQPHACPCEGGGTDHVQGRLAIGPVVRAAQDLAIDRHDPLALPGEFRHIRGVLTTAQHRAQGDHQQVVELMQSGIASSWVLKALPAGTKFLQAPLPQRWRYLCLESSESERRKEKRTSS